MRRQVLFIQGGGAGVHAGWDNRLVDSLRRELGPGYVVRYPAMPDEAEPRYTAWREAIEREFADLDDGAVLVGHSVGGTVLVHVLADGAPPFRPAAICLVAAPFIGDGGWSSEEIEARPDLAMQLPDGVPILIYQGENDDTVPPEHAELYARAVARARLNRLPGRDHQLNDSLAELAADIRRLTGDADAEPAGGLPEHSSR